MFRKMFGKNEDYIGPEFMSLLDRLTVGNYHRPENFSIASGDVTILDEYCNACGYCVKTCPMMILELIDRKKPIKVGKKTIKKVIRLTEMPKCAACGVCEAICPRDSVYVSKPIYYKDSLYKTPWTKGPLSLPRLFIEKKGKKGRTTGR